MYAVDAPVPAFKSRFLGNMISVRWATFPLSVDLSLSKVKVAVFFQVLVGDHRAEPQAIVSYMTYCKGSQPCLSMMCTSAFFHFFFLAVCYNWWKSIQACFPIRLCCAVVPAVWASPTLLLWRRTVVLWIRRGDTMLSLCVSYSFPFFLFWTKLLKRGAWALHWWLDANAK